MPPFKMASYTLVRRLGDWVIVAVTLSSREWVMVLHVSPFRGRKTSVVNRQHKFDLGMKI